MVDYLIWFFSERTLPRFHSIYSELISFSYIILSDYYIFTFFMSLICAWIYAVYKILIDISAAERADIKKSRTIKGDFWIFNDGK